MLSKSDSKFIKSLQLKKQRLASGLFMIEGRKNILELLQSSFEIRTLYLTQQFYDVERESLARWYEHIEIVAEKQLVQCGTFQSNNAGLAVVKMPDQPSIDILDNLVLVLDDIRDPGNLGTIIRIADWYGLSSIVCSPHCADCYNPKVINASMGSFFRVKCYYTDLVNFLKSDDRFVAGTSMNGQSVYHFEFPEKMALVIGNEASGINENIKPLLNTSLKIPGSGKAESLNAAVATAIFCDNFERYFISKKPN